MERCGVLRGGSLRWAVGVIAFELLTGNPPFNASSMQSLYDKIRHKSISNVRRRRAAAVNVGNDHTAAVV